MDKSDHKAICQKVAVSPEHLLALIDEIQRYVPHSTVWAFGSRVDGTNRPSSDLDVAVHCNRRQSLNELPKLNEALIESDIPFKVQILDYESLPDNMKENIRQKYVVLYQPDDQIGQG